MKILTKKLAKDLMRWHSRLCKHLHDDEGKCSLRPCPTHTPTTFLRWLHRIEHLGDDMFDADDVEYNEEPSPDYYDDFGDYDEDFDATAQDTSLSTFLFVDRTAGQEEKDETHGQKIVIQDA